MTIALVILFCTLGFLVGFLAKGMVICQAMADLWSYMEKHCEEMPDEFIKGVAWVNEYLKKKV